MRAHRRTGSALAISILIALTMAACSKEAPPNPPAVIVPQPGSVKTTSAGVTALMDKLSNVKPPAQGSRAAALVQQATQRVFESPYKDKLRKAGITGTKPLERVEAESSDTTRLFPAVSAQVPKVWIGWYINRSIDAFRQAIDENKPLVLVLAGDWCKHCVNLATDALRCAAVDRFAGDAVFAYSFPDSDKGASAIGGSLKIAGYPTITVLEPESRILLERGRINGYFDAGTLGGHLDTILWKTAPRILPDDFESPLAETREPRPNPPSATRPPRAGGPATLDSALFGAASRGLTHAPPAPKCQ